MIWGGGGDVSSILNLIIIRRYKKLTRLSNAMTFYNNEDLNTSRLEFWPQSDHFNFPSVGKTFSSEERELHSKFCDHY